MPRISEQVLRSILVCVATAAVVLQEKDQVLIGTNACHTPGFRR